MISAILLTLWFCGQSELVSLAKKYFHFFLVEQIILLIFAAETKFYHIKIVVILKEKTMKATRRQNDS